MQTQGFDPSPLDPMMLMMTLADLKSSLYLIGNERQPTDYGRHE
jgi:hypothetical protein